MEAYLFFVYFVVQDNDMQPQLVSKWHMPGPKHFWPWRAVLFKFCLVACRLLLLPHGHTGYQPVCFGAMADPQPAPRGSGVQESIGLMQFTPRLSKFVNWWVPWVVVSRRLLVSSSTDGFLFVWRDSSLSKDSFGVGLTTCCRALKLKCVCIHQREEMQRSLCGRRFPSMFFWANLVQRYLKESSPIFGFRARHKPKFGPCCCTMLHVGTQLP